jgi:hypothetical protein
MTETQMLIAGGTALVSLCSLAISILSFRTSSRNNIVQVAFALHAKLFNELEDYKLLYISEKWDRHFYFNSETRGEPGNFVGSEEEARIDNFLERLNFVCMWLIKVGRREEEKLFRKYIRELYTTGFFQEYFSFLDQTESVPSSGEYFSFIHEYAHRRLGLRRPSVAFRAH